MARRWRDENHVINMTGVGEILEPQVADHNIEG